MLGRRARLRNQLLVLLVQIPDLQRTTEAPVPRYTCARSNSFQPGSAYNFREADARFAIGSLHFSRGFLLAHQRSGIRRREMDFLGDEILAQQPRLPPPQIGQRVVGFCACPPGRAGPDRRGSRLLLLLNQRRRLPDQPAHAPIESTKALILRLPSMKTIVDLLQNHGQLEDPENFVIPDVS